MDVFSETLNTKPLKKRYRKAERYKKELFTCNFQGFAKGLSNFDHDFFLQDGFHKPKLLFANLFECIKKQVYQKFTAPVPLGSRTFLHQTNTSGVKLRHV